MYQKNLIFIANIIFLKQIAYPDEISNSPIFIRDLKSSYIINTILNFEKESNLLIKQI